MHFWKVKALSYASGVLAYRWYALAVAWVICLGGWVAIAAIPDQYRAEARVYIDTDNLMDPLLKGLTVSIDPAQEITMMIRTLLTRPTLEQVVHLTDPTSNSLSAADMEQRVQTLQGKVSVRQLEAKNYYAIGYMDPSAQYATSVTQTLVSILQDNRVGSTRLDMDSVRAFINKQISDYEDRLRDADKRRADFRTAHIDILGKGPAPNRIDAADQARDQAIKDLNAATARRDSLRSQLADTPKTIGVDERMFASGAAIGGIGGGGNGGRAAVGAAGPMQRLQQAQAQLDELRTRYTDNYPDVVATKDLISRLQAQLSASAGKSDDGSTVMVPNPAYAQLQEKLSTEETNIAALRQRVGAATSELTASRRDAAEAIDVQAQFNGLDRDYSNIERTYQELLRSREAAALSQARDDQNQGISFRVLEPAQLPQFPSAPNRVLLNSMVLLFGVAGGIALALLLTLNAGKFLTADEVSEQFGLPILGVVTALPQTIGLVRGRLSTVAISMGVGALLLSYVAVVALLRTSLYSVLGL